jgi:hypothetical protein
MSIELYKCHGNKYLNQSFFHIYLHVYADYIKYYRRILLSTSESTISYKNISSVQIKQGLLFSNIEVITASGNDIEVKYIYRPHAQIAKKIIEQKIHDAHKGYSDIEYQTHIHQQVNDYENSLKKLHMLKDKKDISKSEFKKVRNRLIKKLK